MTELELARALLADDPDEMDEAWLARIIAAARQEGAALALHASMTPVARGYTDEQIAARRETRDAALEEAATVCRLLGQGGNMETALACAAAIRTLKDKG